MLLFSDETPVNCQRFLDGGGMELFLRCYRVSICDKVSLLYNKKVLLRDRKRRTADAPPPPTSGLTSGFVFGVPPGLPLGLLLGSASGVCLWGPPLGHPHFFFTKEIFFHKGKKNFGQKKKFPKIFRVCVCFGIPPYVTPPWTWN